MKQLQLLIQLQLLETIPKKSANKGKERDKMVNGELRSWMKVSGNIDPEDWQIPFRFCRIVKSDYGENC